MTRQIPRHLAALAAVCALAGLPLPAGAQDRITDPVAAAEVMAQACIPATLDFDTLFAGAVAVGNGLGLPVLTQDEKVSMWGSPVGNRLMVTRTIDSMACALDVIPPDGTEGFFEALRDAFGPAVLSIYPKAIVQADNTPSPHNESHHWVFSVPGDRHFAATLSWDRERGVNLAVGYRQLY